MQTVVHKKADPLCVVTTAVTLQQTVIQTMQLHADKLSQIHS